MDPRRHIGTIAVTAMLAVLSACGSDNLLGPDAPQGVAGLVLIGPQCPVQPLDDPCPDLPYVATIEVRARGGGSVATVRSEADGTFRVGLRPGLYTLEPRSGDPFPHARAEEVEVRAGEYTEVTILYDTGIR
jgi:hypothetical protein